MADYTSYNRTEIRRRNKKKQKVNESNLTTFFNFRNKENPSGHNDLTKILLIILI